MTNPPEATVEAVELTQADLDAAQAVMNKSDYPIWPADAKANIAQALAEAHITPTVSREGQREAIAREIERYGKGLVPGLRQVCTWLADHYRNAEIDGFPAPPQHGEDVA